ncbi:MAG: hypothetical protein PHV47_01495 [Candidatus Pacebacteria bacterium]|nr:hypothetical protein [Candidatus Paceibacterota bacterium]
MPLKVFPVDNLFVGMDTIRHGKPARELPRTENAEKIVDSLFQDGVLPGKAREAVCVSKTHAWLFYWAGMELRVCRSGLDIEIPAGTMVITEEVSESVPLLP